MDGLVLSLEHSRDAHDRGVLTATCYAARASFEDDLDCAVRFAHGRERDDEDDAEDDEREETLAWWKAACCNRSPLARLSVLLELEDALGRTQAQVSLAVPKDAASPRAASLFLLLKSQTPLERVPDPSIWPAERSQTVFEHCVRPAFQHTHTLSRERVSKAS